MKRCSEIVLAALPYFFSLAAFTPGAEAQSSPTDLIQIDQEAAGALEAALDEAGVDVQAASKPSPTPSSLLSPSPSQPPSPAPTAALNRPAEESEAADEGIAPGWYVELSTHPERIDAEIEVSAYNFRNTSKLAAVLRRNSAGLYTLTVGPFADRRTAELEADKLEEDPLARQTPRIAHLIRSQ